MFGGAVAFGEVVEGLGVGHGDDGGFGDAVEGGLHFAAGLELDDPACGDSDGFEGLGVLGGEGSAFAWFEDAEVSEFEALSFADAFDHGVEELLDDGLDDLPGDALVLGDGVDDLAFGEVVVHALVSHSGRWGAVGFGWPGGVACRMSGLLRHLQTSIHPICSRVNAGALL